MAARAVRLSLLVSLGGGLEIFEFFSYAIFANRIAEAFYPSKDPMTGSLLTLSSLAAGFAARPLGAVIMSHFGDRHGRRPVFIAGLLAMSLATFAIGLLPTYAQWGIVPGVLVVALRVVQGLSVGGEMPGAAAYMVESFPTRAPFLTGLVTAFASLGILLATGLSWLLEDALSQAALAAWGWRVPFLIAGAFGLCSMAARRKLTEAPGFARSERPRPRVPLAEVWRHHAAPFLICSGVMVASAGFQGVFLGYLPLYLTRTLHYLPAQTARLLNLGSVAGTLAILIVSALGQVMPPHRLMRIGAFALIAGAYPFFAALVAQSAPLPALFAGAGMVQGLLVGTFAVLAADLFPVDVRFSGSGVAQTLANAVVAGFAPLVCTLLVATTHRPTAPAGYLIVTGLAGLLASFPLVRRSGWIARDHHAIHEED